MKEKVFGVTKCQYETWKKSCVLEEFAQKVTCLINQTCKLHKSAIDQTRAKILVEHNS